MNRWFKKFFYIIATAFALSLTACGTEEEDTMIVIEAGDEEQTFTFFTCEYDDVVVTKSVTCVYRKNGEQEVYFPVSGKLVDKVYVHKGDSVKKGDLLAELSSDSLVQEIETLQYNIAKNELLLGYISEEESLDMQSIYLQYMYNGKSQEWLDDSLNALYQRNDYKEENYSDSLEFDRKKLEALQAELNNSRVYATFDGIVYSIADNLEGTTSNIDKLIMTIVDDKEGYFELVNSEYEVYFKEGESYEMHIAYGNGFGDYELTPNSKESEDSGLSFSVFVGDAGRIEAGATGTIKLEIESKSNVLSLPNECLHKADEDYYVYVVNDDGMREVKWVEIGLVGDKKTEIASGLIEGDKVIRK